LASTDACPHQAFRFERTLALQFHLEMDPPAVDAIVRHCGAEIAEGPFQQEAKAIVRETAHFSETRKRLFAMLDRMYG
jgi:hypothetical protein